jgi:hypothetical protein
MSNSLVRAVKPGAAETLFRRNSAMPPVPQEMPAPFASLTPAPTPRQRWRLAQLFTAPFHDVDDRVARLAAAANREREERRAAMSDVAVPRG